MVVVAYLGAGISLGLFFGLLGRRPELFLSLFSVNLAMLGALLGVYKILTAVLDLKPLASVGLSFRGRWRTELGIGVACGSVMIFAVAFVERVFGLADFAWSNRPEPQLMLWGIFSFIIFSVAGTTEELTFRGYPFQRLVDAIGPVGAVLVFSALFGLAHLGNRSHTWISTANTALVGATLAVAYLRTRALWLPIGIHFSWNFFQGFVLGLPVSGILLPEALVRPDVHGALWITGGGYGPEGSVLTTGVILLATVYLFFSKSIYVSKEMRELVFGPALPQSHPAGVEAAPPSTTESGHTGLPDSN